ncbi:hypothetical protein [Rhodovulum sulfidophilum]|uniref:hypothetical protein n=1 Tax=Rhodovulum sulfidophilum TaxID=35806 RepID=UPI001923673A|nr:hypothetical protein [Rhodovulum sulfidophilum]MBL3563161.1 hypothetical protein [Rhodovulum sulfidophilum]
MNAEYTARLKNLCEALDIPYASTSPAPELAFNVLSRMYLVPTIKSHDERNKVLNEIRGNLASKFDANSVFVSATARLAVTMQEFPQWYNHLNKSTTELVEMYKDLERARYIVGFLAIGVGSTAGGAAAAGAGEVLKSGGTKEAWQRGAMKVGRRLTGQGPILEELSKKAVPRLGAARAGVIGVVVGVGATVLVAHASERMEEIRTILKDGYQKGDMTDDQFRIVFGEVIDPTLVKKYWEM